ncbi:hypothetical protein BDC45DRAFT_602421 [Circinella umbellata]|nr:hypothetical protein BDC45DRAFT_602421 [Circinella umbellata]
MYQEMKEKITSAYIACQNNQQCQDLIGAINSALKKCLSVSIENLALPKIIHPDIPAKNTVEEIKIVDDGCEHRVLYDALLQRMAYGVAPQLRTRSACCKEYWFDLAFDIQVAANTFSLPLTSYSDSIYESELYLPYDIPAQQPLPEIIYLVHGNHFQTIRTKRFPRMTWPPVSPKLLTIWESRVKGDGGKSQMKKDNLQELNELLAAADAIKLEPKGTLYYN